MDAAPDDVGFEMVADPVMLLDCYYDTIYNKLKSVPPSLLADRVRLFCAQLVSTTAPDGQHEYRYPCFKHPSFAGCFVKFSFETPDCKRLSSIEVMMKSTGDMHTPIMHLHPSPGMIFAGATGDYVIPVEWALWAAPSDVMVQVGLTSPSSSSEETVIRDLATFFAPTPSRFGFGTDAQIRLTMDGIGALEGRLHALYVAGLRPEADEAEARQECARNLVKLLRERVDEFTYKQGLFELRISTNSEIEGGVVLRRDDGGELNAQELSTTAEVIVQQPQLQQQTNDGNPLPAAVYRLALELFGSKGHLPMLQTEAMRTALADKLIDDRGVAVVNNHARDVLRREVLGPFCLARSHPGYTVQRGVVLHGPPGTAKSTLARCIYTSFGFRALCEIRSASSFASKYVGESEAMLSDVFKPALDHPDVPFVMVVEEIEALAEQRSSGPDAHHAKWLTHLFSLIDKTSNVLLVCTTNRRESLDSAFIRVGRVSVQIFCGKLNASKASELLLVMLRNLGFNGLDQSLRDLGVVKQLANFSGAQVRGVAEAVARAKHEQHTSQEVASMQSTDIEGALVSAVHRVIGSSQDPDLFFLGRHSRLEFADEDGKQDFARLCRAGGLSGRVLHHGDYLWAECGTAGGEGAVRTLRLKEKATGPTTVCRLAAMLQDVSDAGAATIIDTRRKEFLRQDHFVSELTVECSENARAGGSVVIVDVDNLVGIVEDQSVQHGLSRHTADSMSQETSATSLHAAREFAFQNILGFSQSLAQRVPPSAGDAFCLCVLSTAQPFLLQRLARSMSFSLPPPAFKPPLLQQLGYDISSESLWSSVIHRVGSKEESGLVPLVSRAVATASTAVLMEVTIHRVKDELEIGFTSPFNSHSGSLTAAKTSATLSWKNWSLHCHGGKKELKPKLEGRPSPLRIALVMNRGMLYLYWPTPAGGEQQLQEFQVADLGDAAHPFVSLMNAGDRVSVTISEGISSMPAHIAASVAAKEMRMAVFDDKAINMSAVTEASAEITRTTLVGNSWQPIRFPQFGCPQNGELRIEFEYLVVSNGDLRVGVVPRAAPLFGLYEYENAPHGGYMFRISDMTMRHSGPVKFFKKPHEHQRAGPRRYRLVLNRRRHEISLSWIEPNGDEALGEVVKHVPDVDYEPCLNMHYPNDKVRIIQIAVNNNASEKIDGHPLTPALYDGGSISINFPGNSMLAEITRSNLVANSWQPVRFPQHKCSAGGMLRIEFEYLVASANGISYVGVVPCAAPVLGHYWYGDAPHGGFMFHLNNMSMVHNNNSPKYFKRPEAFNEAGPRRFMLELNRRRGEILLSWKDPNGNRTAGELLNHVPDVDYEPCLAMHYQGDRIRLVQVVVEESAPEGMDERPFTAALSDGRTINIDVLADNRSAEITRTAEVANTWQPVRFPHYKCPAHGRLCIEFEYIAVHDGDCYVGVVPCQAPLLGNHTYGDAHGGFAFRIHDMAISHNGVTKYFKRPVGFNNRKVPQWFKLELDRQRCEIALSWQEPNGGTQTSDLVMHVPDVDYEPFLSMRYSGDTVRICQISVANRASGEVTGHPLTPATFDGRSMYISYPDNVSAEITRSHDVGDSWQPVRFPRCKCLAGGMLTIEFEYMVVNDCFVGVVPCRAPALGNFGYADGASGGFVFRISTMAMYCNGVEKRFKRPNAFNSAGPRRFRLELNRGRGEISLSWTEPNGDRYEGEIVEHIPDIDYEPCLSMLNRGDKVRIHQVNVFQDASERVHGHSLTPALFNGMSVNIDFLTPESATITRSSDVGASWQPIRFPQYRCPARGMLKIEFQYLNVNNGNCLVGVVPRKAPILGEYWYGDAPHGGFMFRLSDMTITHNGVVKAFPKPQGFDLKDPRRFALEMNAGEIWLSWSHGAGDENVGRRHYAGHIPDGNIEYEPCLAMHYVGDSVRVHSVVVTAS